MMVNPRLDDFQIPLRSFADDIPDLSSLLGQKDRKIRDKINPHDAQSLNVRRCTPKISDHLRLLRRAPRLIRRQDLHRYD